MLNTPILLYDLHTMFSAQLIYDSWLMLFWNIMFTACPVLFFGFFEQPFCQSILADGSKYRAYRKSDPLRLDNFVRWIVEALWCSFLVYFAAVNFADKSDVGIWLFGTTIHTVIFAIASVRIMIDTAHWTIPTHVGVFMHCTL